MESLYTFANTYTMPSATDTLVGRASTDTLTNKSLSGATNSVSNIPTSALILNGADSAAVTTDETTTSTTYTDLATPGPAVTVTIGGSGKAFVTFGAGLYSAPTVKYQSVAVSGATIVAASDDNANRNDVATFQGTQSYSFVIKGLTAGSNTFTCKYKTASGTAHFFERTISVIPL